MYRRRLSIQICIDRSVQLKLDAGLCQTGSQHLDNLRGFPVAKQLPQRLLVPRDPVPVDQIDEIPLCIARQRRFREMRIARDKVFGAGVKIGKVAATATGHQDLFADDIRRHAHLGNEIFGNVDRGDLILDFGDFLFVLGDLGLHVAYGIEDTAATEQHADAPERQQDEQDLQEKLQKQKAKAQRVKVLKDW